MKKKILGQAKGKSIMIFMLVLIMLVSCTAVTFGKAKTKKMTVYDQVYKTGNTAYCCDGFTIYKINLKTDLVKQITEPRLVMHDFFGSMHSMKVYKNYIYYVADDSYTFYSKLKRVKKTGGKSTSIASFADVDFYVINKSKIYYSTIDVAYYKKTGNFKDDNRIMNLNGKRKKKSKYHVHNNIKKSNVKGYNTYWVESEDCDYLEGAGTITTYMSKKDGTSILLNTYQISEMVE